MLNSVTPVDIHFATIVNPGNPESDYSFGLCKAVEKTMFGIFREIRCKRPKAFHHLGHCLHIFRLPRDCAQAI